MPESPITSSNGKSRAGIASSFIMRPLSSSSKAETRCCSSTETCEAHSISTSPRRSTSRMTENVSRRLSHATISPYQVTAGQWPPDSLNLAFERQYFGQTPSQNRSGPVHFLKAPPGLGPGALEWERPEPRATCRREVDATLEAMFPLQESRDPPAVRLFSSDRIHNPPAPPSRRILLAGRKETTPG